MGRILWLPGVLRAAGVDVYEEPGWKTRGRDDFEPFGLIAHATAGGLAQTNQSAVSLIINGRPGLSGPIGQAMIERGTGRWRVVASGAGNHAKTGWAGPLKGHGNRTLIGVECHHTNISDPDDDRFEPWNPVVYESYVVGFAAICRYTGWNPITRIAAHKEHQPGEKSDPTFNPGAFREHVKQRMSGSVPLTEGDFDMIKVIAVPRADQVHYLGLIAGGRPVPIGNNTDLERWRALARAALQPTDLSIPSDLYDAAFGQAVNVPPGGEQLAAVVAAAVDSRISAIARAAVDEAVARVAAAGNG